MTDRRLRPIPISPRHEKAPPAETSGAGAGGGGLLFAAVLTDMDATLSALEQRRDKTRALKQGMMQELLTGRTRLI